jgi:hypothetical protein
MSDWDEWEEPGGVAKEGEVVPLPTQELEHFGLGQLPEEQLPAGVQDLERVVNLLRFAKALKDSLEQQYKGRKAQIEALENYAQFKYGASSEAVTRALLMQNTGKKPKKSVKEIWGTVGFRSQPARVVIEDEQAVIDSVKDTELAHRILRFKVDSRALQAHFKATGEIPEGCRLEEPKERWYWK